MRLIQFAPIARLLPQSVKNQMARPWNRLLAWEQLVRERHFYKQFVTKDSLVFDVGANIGMKSAAFLGLGARVIACEPNPVCVEHLSNRFKREIADRRLTVIPCVIGKQNAKIKLNQFWEDGANSSASALFSSMLENCMGKSTATFDVDVITAEELFSRFGRPDFVKIDVEGMEADVLSTFPSRPAILSVEYHLDPSLLPSTIASLSELNRLGFTYGNFTFSSDTRLQLKAWVTLDNLLQNIQTHSEGVCLWGDAFVR